MNKIQSTTANGNKPSRLPAYLFTARGYGEKATKGFGKNSSFLDGCAVGNAWLNSQSENERRFVLVFVAMSYKSTFDLGNSKIVKGSFRDSLPQILGESNTEVFWSGMPDEFSSELSRCSEWVSGFVSSITDRIHSDSFLTLLKKHSQDIN